MTLESGFDNDLLEIKSKEKGVIELDDDIKLDIHCFCKTKKIEDVLRSSDDHYSITLRDAAVYIIETYKPDELQEDYIYAVLKELLVQRNRKNQIPHIISTLKKIKNNSINDKKDEKSEIKNKTIKSIISFFM